jgi:hypothetical protein
MCFHFKKLLHFSNDRQSSCYNDVFSLPPLLRICPHEAVFPPFVNLPCFINIVGVLHMNFTNWLNFLTHNNLFILSSSTFMSLKDLRFFALLILSRSAFKVLGLQVSVFYNEMGMFLIPLFLFDYICRLSPLTVVSIRCLSFPLILSNDK